MPSSIQDIWKRGQTDPLSISIEILFARLAETIAWCDQFLKRAEILPSMRSAELMPRILHSGRDDALCEVGVSRSWRVRPKMDVLPISIPDLKGGRMLVYFPEADLADRAAEAVSKKFFDCCNTPPWDTWVSYFEDSSAHADCYGRYLLAYVPEIFVPLADAGVLVNPEECICWYSEAQVKLRQHLASD